MREWLNRAVWRTVGLRGSVGSNPTPSTKKKWLCLCVRRERIKEEGICVMDAGRGFAFTLEYEEFEGELASPVGIFNPSLFREYERGQGGKKGQRVKDVKGRESNVIELMPDGVQGGFFHGEAVWDTSSEVSMISHRVVDQCQLEPLGPAEKDILSVEDEFWEIYDIYPVVMGFSLDGLSSDGLIACEVLSEKSTESVFLYDTEVVIGMDIITLGDLAISHSGSGIVFSYRYPSLGVIDFVGEDGEKSQNGVVPLGSNGQYDVKERGLKGDVGVMEFDSGGLVKCFSSHFVFESLKWDEGELEDAKRI